MKRFAFTEMDCLTFAEYRKRLRNCIAWQWRWGVARKQLKEIVDCYLSFGLLIIMGLMACVMIVFMPLWLLVEAVWAFTIDLLILPLLMDVKRASALEALVSEAQDAGKSAHGPLSELP